MRIPMRILWPTLAGAAFLLALWGAPARVRWQTPLGFGGVQASADGRLLVLSVPPQADQLLEVRVLEAASGRELQAFPGEEQAGIQLSADGSHLLVAGASGNSSLWNVQTGEQRIAFVLEPFAPFNTSWRAGFALSASGERAAWVAARPPAADGASEATPPSVVEVWSPEVSDLVRLEGAQGPLDVSPDGRLIATLGGDRCVRLWDAVTGEELHRFAPHSFPAAEVRFSPDGRRLVSLANCGNILEDKRPTEIKLYEVAARTETAALDVPGIALTQLAFTPDGNLLTATSTLGGGQFAWRIDGESPRELPTALAPAAISRDGRQYAIADGTPLSLVFVAVLQDSFIRILRTDTGETAAELRLNLPASGDGQAAIEPVAFSEDGRQLWVQVTCQDAKARMWATRRWMDLFFQWSWAPRVCQELWCVELDSQRVLARLPGAACRPDGRPTRRIDRQVLTIVTRGEQRWLVAWDAPVRPAFYWLLGGALPAIGLALVRLARFRRKPETAAVQPPVQEDAAASPTIGAATRRD